MNKRYKDIWLLRSFGKLQERVSGLGDNGEGLEQVRSVREL
jgi:hypothetical protein